MWKSLDAAGHPFDVFEPSTDRPRNALIFLHDEDGHTLRGDIAAIKLLERHRLGCLCPRGGPSWWSSRVCTSFDPAQSAEQWLLTSILPMIEQLWSLPPKATGLIGIGMGGQGALRLGFKYPERFPIVGAINAAVDHYELYGQGTPLDDMYPSREHCRQDGAILHIHPVRQPLHVWFAADPRNRWFRGNDRLHEKLMALGVAHAFVEKAVGIEALIDFLIEAFHQESRRLL